jgi:hypothetical protein
MSRLYPADGALALESPYQADLVAGIKNLPYSDRKWDTQNKRWLIAPAHARTVVDLVARTTGERLPIPDLAPTGPGLGTPTMRMVKVEYIGRCRLRGPEDSEATATGYCDGSWSVVFPEALLRSWFLDEKDAPRAADGKKTLYQVLAIKPEATAEELKKAYRQLARQWHPDVCREPDAREQFERIQHAYELLRDDQKRKRYNAGLKLEAATAARRPKNFTVHRHDDDVYGYRAPLRCGLLLIEGFSSLGAFTVSKIHAWQDIVDNQGRTLVSSWPKGADSFEVRWV